VHPASGDSRGVRGLPRSADTVAVVAAPWSSRAALLERGVDGRPGSPDVAYSVPYLLWLVLANEGLDVEELTGLGDQPVQTELASPAR